MLPLGIGYEGFFSSKRILPPRLSNFARIRVFFPLAGGSITLYIVSFRVPGFISGNPNGSHGGRLKDFDRHNTKLTQYVSIRIVRM